MMDTTGTLFLPPGQSTIAPEVDSLFNFILYAGTIFFMVVVGLMIYFVIKYRRRGADEVTPDIAHNTKLEIIWTVVPTLLVMVVFYWGFHIYLKMHVPPKDAFEVKVTGQKWFWSFDYPGGGNGVNELVVPAGKPVKLLLSSKDVIHSFYVPDFRIKMDVLPNRYTVTWFDAPNPGVYNLFCSEYCGTSHSKMIGTVKVLGEREFAAWQESSSNAGAGMTPETYGEQLYTARACATCHKVDGSQSTGPSWKGIYGHPVKLADGSQVTVDENYIRESVLVPGAKVVAGYQNVMPTYQGILNSKQIDALVAYIKSLK